MIQGNTFEELKENLKDIYIELSSGMDKKFMLTGLWTTN